MTSSSPLGFQNNPTLRTLRVPGSWPGTPVLDVHRLVNLDYVLLSHDHQDHQDEKNLKQVAKQNPNARYSTGLGMTDLVRPFTQSAHIEEAGWYQCYKIGEGRVTIIFVPYRHWSTHSLSDTNQRL
ncbi:MAG: hypothetical protein EOO39_37805 [Cytophagaceae bacterium]|nr:MAG: hypothetical protein EOO39_37805 [Cytophagaceae bacterium]